LYPLTVILPLLLPPQAVDSKRTRSSSDLLVKRFNTGQEQWAGQGNNGSGGSGHFDLPPLVDLQVSDHLQHIECGDDTGQQSPAGNEDAMDPALEHDICNLLDAVFLAYLENHRCHDLPDLHR
jgi:hypothetical protein